MTADHVREAIARVSQWTDDPSEDRAEAEHLAALARTLRRDELYVVLVAGGLEGIRPSDGKAELLRRFRLRLTARVRAWERCEV